MTNILKKIRVIPIFAAVIVVVFISAFSVRYMAPQEDLKGKYAYKDFESAKKCRTCHPGIYEQWSQAMMSKAYTHEWDEIEYFDLAVAHAAANPALKDVVDGCNGCHTPIAYMGGALPPPRPSAKSMANESVSCEVCHLIQANQSDPPSQFQLPDRTWNDQICGSYSLYRITGS